MNNQVISVIIVEGGKLISEFLRLRSPRNKVALVERPADEQTTPRTTLYQPSETVAKGKNEDNNEKKGKACLPCVNSHSIACVGLLNEAYRMSPDGLNEESNERVEKCLAEIAQAERVDLAPENIAKLPPNEKPIAEKAAKGLREIRHGLEWLKTREELATLAAQTSELQKYVGGEWFKLRLARMSSEEKVKIVDDAVERIGKDGP